MSCVLENFFYIISVSFQIAGALLLVLFSISTKRDSVICRFVGNGIITKDGDSKILDYNENAYKEEYRRAFLNKYSFGCILLGYMLSIWGEIEDGSRLEASIYIALLSLIMILMSIGVSSLWVNFSKKCNRRIESDDLKRLKIEPSMETMSQQEVNDIIQSLEN